MMPQIWMTDEEIGELLGCNFEGARAGAISQARSSKRSRDALSRATLSGGLTGRYTARLALKPTISGSDSPNRFLGVDVRGVQDRVTKLAGYYQSQAA